MKEGLKPGTLSYLVNVNIDLFTSILLVEILYILRWFAASQFIFDYSLTGIIFVTIFSVNFTVFTLSKFLLENYPRIKSERIRKNINAVFKTPIKTSIIGAIFSIIFYTLNLSFLNYFAFLIYFLLFYSILSSYYVFKFVYEISIQKGKS